MECCHASARARTECLHARDLLPTTPLRPWGAPLCYARRSCCGGLWNGVRSACYNYASHLRLSLNSPKCWKPPLPFNQSTFHASHTQWLYPNHPHPGAHGAGGCRQGAAAIPPLSQRPCMGSPRPPPPRPCVLEATGPMWGAAGDEQRRAVSAPWRPRGYALLLPPTTRTRTLMPPTLPNDRRLRRKCQCGEWEGASSGGRECSTRMLCCFLASAYAAHHHQHHNHLHQCLCRVRGNNIKPGLDAAPALQALIRR